MPETEVKMKGFPGCKKLQLLDFGTGAAVAIYSGGFISTAVADGPWVILCAASMFLGGILGLVCSCMAAEYRNKFGNNR